jgi:hypothetical protein
VGEIAEPDRLADQHRQLRDIETEHHLAQVAEQALVRRDLGRNQDRGSQQ